MKSFLLRLTMATAVTLAAMALTSSSNAQQADSDPAANGSAQRTGEPQESKPASKQNEAQMPASDDAQTQDAKAFSGRIVTDGVELVLRDSVATISYKLDDQNKAKQYAGKQVRVTGRLSMNSNTIHVERIEVLS